MAGADAQKIAITTALCCWGAQPRSEAAGCNTTGTSKPQHTMLCTANWICISRSTRRTGQQPLLYCSCPSACSCLHLPTIPQTKHDSSQPQHVALGLSLLNNCMHGLAHSFTVSSAHNLHGHLAIPTHPKRQPAQHKDKATAAMCMNTRTKRCTRSQPVQLANKH